MLQHVHQSALPERERRVIQHIADHDHERRNAQPLIADALVNGAVFGADPTGTPDPATIFAGNLLQWCRADVVSVTGSDVDQFTDQSGNAEHYTAAGAARPTLNSAALNGQDTITFDGADHTMLASALDLPAPGTTPTYCWIVARQLGWSSNAVLASAEGGNVMAFKQSGSSPNTRQDNNGAANGPLNSAGIINSWFLWQMLWSNSTSDYVTIGSTTVTGTDTGNSNSTGRRLGSRNAGLSKSNIEIGEIGYCAADASAGQKTALATYVSDYWGGSVGV